MILIASTLLKSFSEKCYFLCEEKNLQEVTCLSGRWSLDMDHTADKLACKMRLAMNLMANIQLISCILVKS